MDLTAIARLIPGARLRKYAYTLGAAFLVRPRVDRMGVPIIAVTGTNGKTTVCNLLYRIYLDAGYRVGLATTDGVMCRRETLLEGDKAGISGLWRLASCDELDVIVAETARGGILHNGLGFSSCSASVVTNVHEDHLGLGGIETVEEMAELKATLPRHTVASTSRSPSSRARSAS